jgi:uncharacterized protein
MSVKEITIDRIGPTQRPSGKPCGYQRWSNLLFIHWPIDPAAIQELLPSRLSVDTFNGQAWIGLVPFHMSGVRPRFFPAVPGVSAFHETNVRTYVHLDGQEPGVWFFSLEAAKSLAVRIARWQWHLPYFKSRMSLNRDDQQINYSGSRLWPGEPGAGYNIEATIGDAIQSEQQTGTAAPGTFEHFLAERYLLYAETPAGGLLRGQVHHSPYPLRQASLQNFQESLLSAAGLFPDCEPANTMFSEGVDVDIFSLKTV